MAVNQFLEALKKIQPFPNDKFVNRLYNKARRCSNIVIFQGNLPPAPAYGQDPDSMKIDGVDVTAHLQLLAEQAAVDGLARYAPGADKHGLRNCANTAAAGIAADALFTQTSTMLYSEHINWSLAAGGSPDLQALRSNVDFVNGLDTELANPHFISGAIRQDLVSGDHTYTTALLFTYDYVHLGPGFTPHLDDDLASAPSGKLLAKWIPPILAGLSTAQKAAVALALGKATSLVHAITGASGAITPFIPAAKRAQALTSMKIFPAADAPGLDQLTNLDKGTWQSIADQNKVLWGNTSGTWANAVATIASRSTSSTGKTGSDAQAFGEGVLIGVTLGLEDHQTWTTTTITGQDVANWINQGRQGFNSLFTQNAPNVVDVNTFTTDGPVQAKCFVAGTQVAVEGGSVAIEKITEGTRILTRADPNQYGVASDEDVVVPLSVPLLCGINDEAPFFTPGHVFYTTAGLKAVDPVSAREENPWLDVGRLAPGHILYRLSKDNKTYEQVAVNSIKVDNGSTTHVYGVHLREGRRSYHANGYLVAVNYPEITVKSIARVLATLPKHVRTAMLYHINEIKPVFQRFGAATISDVLTKEIRGVKRRPVSAPVARGTRRRITSHLRKAKRTYLLHQTGSHNVSNYQLPTLSIHEGVVSLDGEAQPRGMVDKSDRTIRWTRPVPEYGYEHGFVDVNNHGLAGRGTIILSKDPDLRELSPHDSDANKVVRFQAAKPNVDVTRATKVLNHANMDKTIEALRAKSQTPAPASPVAPTKPLTIPGLNLATSAPVTGTPDPIDNEDYWDLTLDQAVWPVGQVKTSPTKPMSMGQIAFATYHAGGTSGLSVPILTVPALDQLLVDINKSQLAGQTQMDSLYSSMVEITDDGKQMGTVYLDSAAVLYQLADKPSGHTELSSLFNVTFKSIGSSVKLPLLFRTLAVELSADFSSARGAATEYNYKNRGGDGDRHYVQDASTNSFSTAAVINRATVSKALAIARPQPVGMSASASATPAPVTMQLNAVTDLSVDGLEGITDYNSVALHSTSQTMLQNMMLYHMNANDRTTFLQTTAPANLPLDLGANLQSNLKQWIQNTYGPAFISFMVSQTKAQDISWRNGFSDAEIDKVWYWWNGQGSSCLSMTSEYNQLNGLTSVYAMRQLYGSVLNNYLTSSQGPTYWANQMYNTLTGNPHSMSNVLRKPINGGESILNKYCNIILALDPTSTAADNYFNAVVAYAIKQNISNPYFPLNQAAAQKQKEWMNDAMSQLIILVLNNDPSLGSTVGPDLKADLDNLISAEGIDEKLTAAEKAQEIVTKAAELTGNIVSNMSWIAEGLQAIGRCNGFKAAAAVVNRGIAKLSNAGGFPYLKGVMLLVTVGGYVFQSINTFTNWSNLSAAQQAIAIISTVAMAVDVAGKSYELFKDIKTWNANRKSVDLTPNEAAKGEVLDQKLNEEIQSPDGIQEINAVNEKVNNGESLQKSYLESVSNKEQDTESAKVVDNGVDDIVPGDALAAEVGKEPPADLPAKARGDWEAFTTSEKVLKCANIAVGVAFTIAMSIDLKNNWDNYTDAGKVLNVLQICIQGLTVLLDVALLIGDAAVAAGVLAADCAMMVALPVLGAILAVIGIVVMILLSTLGVIKPQQPPPSPVEVFITNTARPLIAGFLTPPAPSLTYSVPTQVPAGNSSTGLTITATNKTKADVTLTRSTLTLEVGSDAAALFSGPTTKWTVDAKYGASKSKLSTAGTAGASPAAMAAAQLTEQDRGDSLAEYDLALLGPNTAGTSGPLVVKAGQSVMVAWLGALNSVGSTTLQIVETLVSGDKCRFLANINRV